jgi:sugar-specific transcriptional regulator TrmB
LLEKGFVSFIMKEKTKHFQAIEPVRIRDFIEKQENVLQESRKTFEKLLPDLEKLSNFIGMKEEVEIFTGEKGLLSAYDILLKGAVKNEKVSFFDVPDRQNPEKAENFYAKTWSWMSRLGIIAEGISNIESKGSAFASKYPKFIQQRYVPFPVPGNIDIFKDKILITVWKEKPIGILIHSQEVSENFKAYFQSIWKIAKS